MECTAIQLHLRTIHGDEDTSNSDSLYYCPLLWQEAQTDGTEMLSRAQDIITTGLVGRTVLYILFWDPKQPIQN